MPVKRASEEWRAAEHRPSRDASSWLEKALPLDMLLSEDYLETVPRKFHLEPEKELMLAVLEDAINCFQRNIFNRTGKEKALFQNAEDWILEEGSSWLYSFETVCETLDINPNYLREGLIE